MNTQNLINNEKYFLGVEIEINHHCNLSCTYCPNVSEERKGKGKMSKEMFTKIMKQLQDINYQGRISYHFYNEPLLHPELDSFVKLSKEMLPKTRSEIFTNGMFLNEEKYYNLRTAGVDKFTITKHKGIQKIAFDDFYINLPSSEKESIKYYQHNQLIYSNRGGLVNAGKIVDQPLNRKCLIPICSLVITVEGNVIPCYEDFHEKNIMGNVFEEHIRDIWEKPKYREFREDLKLGLRHKYDVCKTCNNLQVIQ